jgi:hypothetical protein
MSAGASLACGPTLLRCSDQGRRRAHPRPRHGTGLTFRA